MKLTAIAALASVLFAGNAIAEGVSDNAGTIFFGFKLGPTNITHDSTGKGFYGGYTIYGPNTFMNNAHLAKTSIAAEGEFADLGRPAGNIKSKASTLGLVAAATYPINEQFSFIAKAGWARVNHQIDCGSAPCSGSTITQGLHTATALQYNMATMMALRAGYDLYPDRFRMISLSAIFKL